MPAKGFSTELDQALARKDANELTRIIDAYEAYFQDTDGEGEWPEKWSEAFGDTLDYASSDPDKALAYVVLAAARSNCVSFLAFLACGPLEDILREPSAAMTDRIVTEARKSPRFRWLLSHPFKVAVSERVWVAIEPFRITGPHEEPSHDTMPKSYFG